MKCYSCDEEDGSDMEYKMITVDFNVEGVLVKIVNVPAYVCPNCKENIITAEVLAELENITNDVREGLKNKTAKKTAKEIIYDLVA